MCIESNRQDLVQSGAVAVFIKLLESRDIDVQFYCAAALSNIAVHGKQIIPILLTKNFFILSLSLSFPC